MNTVCKLNQCAGCMACLDICPVSAIKIVDSLDAYNAVIDNNLCINCGACHRVCQSNNSSQLNSQIFWKQGWANKEIRDGSSSGGFATALMLSFIGEKRYVAACLFKNGEFLFDITNDRNKIKCFSGSKYVKSNPTGIYKKVKEKISAGNEVLFIGLPCQVSSMINYVGEKYSSNLYTIDLICHGSPSPKLLRESLKEYGYNLSDVKNIAFRDNTKFGVSTDIKKIAPPTVQDRYTMAFLKGLCYTENCYSCHYAQPERVGDITIGDSWGTELKDELKDGVSLALCQTSRGVELLKHAGLNLIDVDLDNAIDHNQQLKGPSKVPTGRDQFFTEYKKSNNFNKSVAMIYKKACAKQDIKALLIKLHLLKGGGIAHT
jgi:coenzyme F420-reducing hydrogenase beta subunit